MKGRRALPTTEALTRQKPRQRLTNYHLENFGEFDYIDEKDEKNKNATRHVRILPLYAINTIKL